jgi:hypothetical protein
MKNKLYSIVLTSILALPLTPVFAAPDITGWWGFSPEGCFDDKDNQFRVALGKWERTENHRDGVSLRFGKGQEKIGFYDSICFLSQRKDVGNMSTYSAVCDYEGEKIKGAGRIVNINEFTVRVFMPSLTDNGLLLVKCGNLTRHDLCK